MSEIKIIDFGDLDEKQEEKGKDFFDLDKLNKFIENINKLLENLGKNKIQQINSNSNKQQIVAEVIMKFEKFLESNPNYLDMKIKDFLQFIKENRNQVINILSK